MLLAIVGVPALISVLTRGKGENHYFEATVEDATDVMYATYLGYSTDRNDFIHEFRVDRLFKGETAEETIHVYSYGKTTRFTYMKNKKYYLALQRWVDVYYPYDRYLEIYSTRVNSRQEAKLTEEIKSILLRIKETYPKHGWIIETQPYFGTDYVRSDELSDIVDGSDNIFVVKTKQIINGVESRTTFIFTILEVLKGSAEEETITMILPQETAEIGKKYILFADSQEGGVFRPSSKHSLQPRDKLEEIKKLING